MNRFRVSPQQGLVYKRFITQVTRRPSQSLVSDTPCWSSHSLPLPGKSSQYSVVEVIYVLSILGKLGFEEWFQEYSDQVFISLAIHQDPLCGIV